jgi:hypothetical protein
LRGTVRRKCLQEEDEEDEEDDNACVIIFLAERSYEGSSKAKRLRR